MALEKISACTRLVVARKNKTTTSALAQPEKKKPCRKAGEGEFKILERGDFDD